MTLDANTLALIASIILGPIVAPYIQAPINQKLSGMRYDKQDLQHVTKNAYKFVTTEQLEQRLNDLAVKASNQQSAGSASPSSTPSPTTLS